jgi:hypothetical protein
MRRGSRRQRLQSAGDAIERTRAGSSKIGLRVPGGTPERGKS